MEISSTNTASVAPAQRATRTEQTQQRQVEQQQSEVKANNTAQAAPVINTQGQTTGRLLNVTA